MSKPRTLIEAVQHLESLRHKSAVWTEIVGHLSKCLDGEVKKADRKIVAEQCVEESVPQSVIQETIDFINENHLDPLNEDIYEIEGMMVAPRETNEQEEETTKKAKPKLRVKKKVNPKPKKPRNQAKGMRVISGGSKE